MASADPIEFVHAEAAGSDRPAPSGAPDPIIEAVQAGRGGAGPGKPSLRYALAEARDLTAQARSDGGFQASLPRALALVRFHPEAADLQITVARLMMEGGDRRAYEAWSGIDARFPEAIEPFRMMVRILAREKTRDAAKDLVTRRFPAPSEVVDEPGLITLGCSLEELGQPRDAEEIFRRASRLFPRSPAAWRRLIALQEARGALMSAEHTAAEAASNCDDERLAKLHVRLTRQLKATESFAPRTLGEDSPLSVKALAAILADVGKQRALSKTPQRCHLGATMMITGSLGSGGAERQLVSTVMSLNEAAIEGRRINGHEIAGPVMVACRSLSSKQGYDFFLETLAGAGVPVTEYGRLPPSGGAARLSRAWPWRSAVEFLPPRTREGVERLVEYIRFEAPDVVQIWQDGMVLASGLAALMAGTPRIVLSVRTLPPTDRVNRWSVELEPIYRALLSSRGVVMTANSTLAARRYEAWLGLPKGAVPVIHNGVERLSEAAAPGDEAMWQEFAWRTREADFTVGGVMRLDRNKRPLEWLTVAERLHRRHPGARFIVVGEGALRLETLEYARRLGLSDRVLFTGRSSSVGFWLARMDALMLLSRYEGTPNVLIEAQLAGTPVVSTPAGGAAETMIPEVTGFVLASAETPDLDEAVAKLSALIALGPERRREMGEAARAWAERTFSVETMLGRTVDLFMAPDFEPMLPRAS